MTITIVSLIVFPIIFACMDRLRGSSFGIGKTPEALMYGSVVSLLLIGYADPWFNLAFSILFLAGSSLGWGQPIGWLISGNKTGNYENWQKGILQDNPHLAVIVRGLIWGLCPVILVYWKFDIITFVIAMPIAFYLAAITSKIILSKGHIIAWELHEYLRGFYLGIFIIGLKYLYEFIK